MPAERQPNQGENHEKKTPESLNGKTTRAERARLMREATENHTREELMGQRERIVDAKNRRDLSEELAEEGLEEEEILAVAEAIPDLFTNNPEFHRYLKKLLPRLRKLNQECAQLTGEGCDKDAAEKILTFFDAESKQINIAIRNPKIRQELQTYIAAVTDLRTKAEEYKNGGYTTVLSEAVNFIPGVGEAKMVYEAYEGRTMDGRKLSKGERALNVGIGLGKVAAAIATGGISEVIINGAQAVKVGAEGVKIGSAGVKLVATAEKIITVTNGVKNFSKAAGAIAKVEAMFAKSPRLIQYIGKQTVNPALYKTLASKRQLKSAAVGTLDVGKRFISNADTKAKEAQGDLYIDPNVIQLATKNRRKIGAAVRQDNL